MKKIISILFIIQSFVISNSFAQDSCIGTSCMPEKVKNECLNMQDNGCVDWNNGVVYAVGMGVANPDFKSAAQRNYSAYQAAKTVAMRNLLQMVESVNIDSDTTVKDGMLQNDTIRAQISGKLKGVQEVGRPQQKGDGSVWVTMKLYLKDIMSVVAENRSSHSSGSSPFETEGGSAQQSQQDSPVEEDRSSQLYGGLIIDARNIAVTPALSPKVLDERGEEVYGSAHVSREFSVTQGMAGYAKDVEKAKKSPRFQGKPLIIQAIKSSGKNGSDLVVSNKDAELLRKIGSTQTFLREARVMVVLK